MLLPDQIDRPVLVHMHLSGEVLTPRPRRCCHTLQVYLTPPSLSRSPPQPRPPSVHSVGCLLETESTVAPPPLSQEASADTGGRSGGGGGGGTGLSTNIVNPNASRARGVGGGGGGGTGGAGRKGNNSGASRRGSQSSASVGTTGAAGGGASKMNIDGGGAFEEIESPIDARCG